MKTLYLDIFSGISGDMLLGALIDLGLDFHQLEHELEKLRLDGYHLHATRGQKATITGTKFDVHLAHDHPHSHTHHEPAVHDHSHTHSHGHHHHHEHEEHSHEHEREHEREHEHEAHAHEHEHGRNFSEIKELINQSALSDWVKQKSIAVFQ